MDDLANVDFVVVSLLKNQNVRQEKNDVLCAPVTDKGVHFFLKHSIVTNTKLLLRITA